MPELRRCSGGHQSAYLDWNQRGHKGQCGSNAIGTIIAQAQVHNSKDRTGRKLQGVDIVIKTFAANCASCEAAREIWPSANWNAQQAAGEA